MVGIIRWIERDLSRGEVKLAHKKLKYNLLTLGEEERKFLRFYFENYQASFTGNAKINLPSEKRFKRWRQLRCSVKFEFNGTYGYNSYECRFRRKEHQSQKGTVEDPMTD